VDSKIGENMIKNSKFIDWSGVAPDGDRPNHWVVTTQTLGEYITEDQDGARLVSDGSNMYMHQTVLEIGKKYQYMIKLTKNSGGNIRLYHSPSSTTIRDFSNSGTYYGLLTAADVGIAIKRAGACDWTIHELVIQEVTGLVAAYNMIPSGNTLVDISGNGNNGTVEGGALVTKDGMKFRGAGYQDYVGVIGNVLPNLNEFTCCCRFNTGLFTPGVRRVVLETTPAYSISLEINTGGSLITQTLDESGYISTGFGSIKENTDVTAVIVYKDNVLSAYKNGILIGSVTGEAPTAAITGLHIGTYRTINLSRQFNGEVKDVRIYNYGYSPKEVQAYHNSFQEITLRETFSDEGADGVNKLPRGWM